MELEDNAGLCTCTRSDHVLVLIDIVGLCSCVTLLMDGVRLCAGDIHVIVLMEDWFCILFQYIVSFYCSLQIVLPPVPSVPPILSLAY
ncbi:7116_t:CDS:2 [Funneliformis mosseae]|uniref:7116_t:CDS:1 n=1 Tax=Funneliformis mosseae TaxID=27381 RepID=A0A9N9ADS2_FUNMO|nr:7116_t:CDS:2 [Funneliformis mosseae]